MKKVKIKERFENAVDAFFDDEKLTENTALSFGTETHFYQKDSSKNSSEKFKGWVAFLKQAFLFLPGTFVLFFLSILFTGLLMVVPPGNTKLRLLVAFGVWLVAGLMTVLGLGDWRKPKYFLIPASIISLAGTLAAVSILWNGFRGLVSLLDNYAIYFFPLALIVPFLVKGWLEKNEKGEN